MRVRSHGLGGWQRLLRYSFAPAALGLTLIAPVSGAHATNLPLSVCAQKLAGTYLSTVTTQQGGFFVLRSLVTFSPAGAVSVVESTEAGVPNVVPPYSDAQGTWACVASGPQTLQVKATVLNFTYGSPQFIARIDYDITLNPATKALTGTLEVRIFPLDGNPLPPPNSAGNPFNIAGQRVHANGQ